MEQATLSISLKSSRRTSRQSQKWWLVCVYVKGAVEADGCSMQLSISFSMLLNSI